ncbi:MAG TPA: SgcJ/EcaC family oxidoreductase [Longimicrobiales bacterium]|nr:SgcJ/EcaC family oxidoreductase [Longimicrobiales bacterium]
MTSPHIATVLALLFVPAWAAPSRAEAQAPGYQQVDTRSIMAEYHAEVIEQVNRVMDRWGAAWGRDEADRVADLYWESAVLIPLGGAPLRGQDAIRDHLTRTLPTMGRVEAFMLDFDASGGMAVVYGNYMLEGEGGAQRSGPLITVYLQRGRTWKIRSQVFVSP